MSLYFTFVFLLAGHALADFPLQGEYLAVNKNRNIQLGKEIIWPYALFWHSVIHGAFVLIITQSMWLCVLEILSHSVIDFIKCEKKITFGQDQFLHVACKVLWVVILKGLL